MIAGASGDMMMVNVPSETQLVARIVNERSSYRGSSNVQ